MAEPIYESIPVSFVIEYPATADASGNSVMKRSRGIDAGGSMHEVYLKEAHSLGKFKYWVLCPLSCPFLLLKYSAYYNSAFEELKLWISKCVNWMGVPLILTRRVL